MLEIIITACLNHPTTSIVRHDSLLKSKLNRIYLVVKHHNKATHTSRNAREHTQPAEFNSSILTYIHYHAQLIQNYNGEYCTYRQILETDPQIKSDNRKFCFLRFSLFLFGDVLFLLSPITFYVIFVVCYTTYIYQKVQYKCNVATSTLDRRPPIYKN